MIAQGTTRGATSIGSEAGNTPLRKIASRENDILVEASNRDDPLTYIREVCGDDHELRDRVLHLHATQYKTGEFDAERNTHPASYRVSESDYAIASTSPGHTQPMTSSSIGAYKLLQQIGEGGMGTVWMAEQQEPVKRQVALKLIRADMNSKEILARFEAERQALAIMDHPNIARVLDAGTTETGTPYFVMELVKGVPLNEYCDRNKLSVRDRLALFIPVCNAIQHAHQKGILHRDLKPSNVLVTLLDGKPVPKVIDFGLAKAIEHTHKLTDKTLFTEFGKVVGTLQYMSPEQAEMSTMDVDTRTDIYSLGVMLYELLTGTTPLEQDSLTKNALLEVLAIIRETEPPVPSVRLSASGDAATGISLQRKITPIKLRQILKGDLDWVVMKAIEKERPRRYETANGFAMDIQRFLNGEPVLAAPPSTLYKVNKFIRRNRTAVAAAALVLVALVLGIAGTTWGLIEAQHQQRIARTAAAEKERALRAEAARAEAEQAARKEAQEQTRMALEAREQEAKAKDRAEKRLLQVEKANEILASIFDSLNPEQIAASEKPLQQVLVENLDSAVEQLQDESIGDPSVVAGMRYRIAKSLSNLGQTEKAIPLFEQALKAFREHLGAEHLDTLKCLDSLSSALMGAGQTDKALPLAEETLELFKQHQGPKHLDTINAMNNLAMAYFFDGQLDKATPLLEEVHELAKSELGPEHSTTLGTMNNLGAAYNRTQPDRAIPFFQESLELLERELGPQHPYTLFSMSNLGSAYLKVGKPESAVPLLKRASTASKAILGSDHRETIHRMGHLAGAYLQMDATAEAIPIFEELVRLCTLRFGPEHIETLIESRNLAMAHWMAGSLERALPLLEDTFDASKRQLGANHPRTLLSMRELAEAYGYANRFPEAMALARDRLAIARGARPANNAELATQLASLGSILLQAREYVKAEPILRECRAIREEELPDSWQYFSALSSLGRCLLSQKKFGEAESLLLAGYAGLERHAETVVRTPFSIRQLPDTIKALVQLYRATDRADEATRWETKQKTSPSAAASQATQ